MRFRILRLNCLAQMVYAHFMGCCRRRFWSDGCVDGVAMVMMAMAMSSGRWENAHCALYRDRRHRDCEHVYCM